MRPLLALAVSLVLVAAGCADKAESHDHDAHDDPHAGHDMGNMTGTNLTAVITILENGTVLGPVNGSIPVETGINLTFDATNSTGDNLTYGWDFGDGNTSQAATETHAFATPGDFEVYLMVMSGADMAETTIQLNVTRGAPAPGTLLHTQVETFSGNLVLGNPNSPTNEDIDYRDHPVTINDTTPNGTGMAKVVRITLDGQGPGAVAMFVYWRQGDTDLATGGAQTPDQSLTYEGDMPAGEYVLRVRLFAGADADYTVRAEIDYEAV